MELVRSDGDGDDEQRQRRLVRFYDVLSRVSDVELRNLRRLLEIDESSFRIEVNQNKKQKCLFD